MNETISVTSGTSALRPRARILRTLGDELISSEVTAVIELVKNAYDADATRVLVRFHGTLDVGKGIIEVIDNGNGMSLSTIQTAWMEPATLYKRNLSLSERFQRRVLGEKGVGRFAASRLANFLEVVTRRANAKEETRVYFDWSQFDDEEKYLDEIMSLWEEVKPSEITSGGTIHALSWDNKLQDEWLSHGTILRMEGLRAEWQDKQLEGLRIGLARLISPFLLHIYNEDEGNATDNQFKIRLQVPPQFSHLAGDIEPPAAVQNPHYSIKGYVNDQGAYDFTLMLKGKLEQERITGTLLVEKRVPVCGPFFVELRVWDRDPQSMSALAREYDQNLKGMRDILDEAAGVSVYRDGFRVLPYGESNNDWLRLDMRRVQNPTLKLSNNQIIGFVAISADENSLLRDQSNREGLMEGRALNDLRELLKMILSKLEEKRYLVRRSLEVMPPEKNSGGLFSGFNLNDVSDFVQQQRSGDPELLSLVRSKELDLSKRVVTVQKILSQYLRQATLGGLIERVLHDGRTPVAKIGNEADLRMQDLDNSTAYIPVERLKKSFSFILNQSEALATIFRRIQPFATRKSGRPKKIRLEQAIADTFAILETEISELGVNIQLPQGNTSVTVDQTEIQEIILNLLENSLYWLGHTSTNQPKIMVEVTRNQSDEVIILFSDNGPGVDSPFSQSIFEPYFSTKPNGVGLGLTIVGEIISTYYGGQLELLESGPLPGATFCITLRRRV